MIDIIKKEYHRRIIEEGFYRIEKCTSYLTEEELWYKPNENSNSVGNLIMHLSGNIKQYIISGIAGELDTRRRDMEFNVSNRKEKQMILDELCVIVNQSNEFWLLN